MVNFLKTFVNQNCFICGGILGKGVTTDYLKCQSCGHAVLKDEGKSGKIINENLDSQKAAKTSALSEYKRNFLLSNVNEREKLLDIGAGSGGFLFRVKADFLKAEGLEITPECVEFAIKELGVRVVADIADLGSGYSAITIWHTLEHFSRDFLKKEMPEIFKKLNPDGKVVISVPNENSFAYGIFGERYPYFDVANHLQQFSVKSLNLYMAKMGFRAEKMSFSFPYSGFCWLQGLLNFFNRRHNYLYYRKKRGWTFGLTGNKLKMLDTWNLILAVILFPLAAFGTLADAFSKKGGATINACYGRKRTDGN